MDITDLYQDKILSFARLARNADRLSTALSAALSDDDISTASIKNPHCGDIVTIDLAIDDGVITHIGADVTGCAICEAATGLAMASLPQQQISNLPKIEKQLKDWLMDEAKEPPFDTVLDFTPIRGFGQRHQCLRLPFQAAVKAASTKE